MANTFWMGWFEQDARKDPAKVLAEALLFYQAKYGNTPNRLRVRTGLENAFAQAAAEHGLAVEAAAFVQPRDLWLMRQEVSLPQEELPVPVQTPEPEPAPVEAALDGGPLALPLWELQSA